MQTGSGIFANAGYTLVELMVAAACLGIAISGVMAMISAGRQMEMESGNRRQARMIANSVLESDGLQFFNYYFLPDSTPRTVKLNPGTPSETAATQIIGYEDELFGMNDSWVSGVPVPIPYRVVQVRISWSVAGRSDSVLVRKLITDY
jgi:type II secretory pathway pseudopilin PulG